MLLCSHLIQWNLYEEAILVEGSGGVLKVACFSEIISKLLLTAIY